VEKIVSFPKQAEEGLPAVELLRMAVSGKWNSLIRG
jgi:hypothetical protein